MLFSQNRVHKSIKQRTRKSIVRTQDIYIYRERERERERGKQSTSTTHNLNEAIVNDQLRLTYKHMHIPDFDLHRLISVHVNRLKHYSRVRSTSSNNLYRTECIIDMHSINISYRIRISIASYCVCLSLTNMSYVDRANRKYCVSRYLPLIDKAKVLGPS
jgi:hypothetical protein